MYFKISFNRSCFGHDIQRKLQANFNHNNMNVTFEIDIQHIEFTKNYLMPMNKKQLIGYGQHLCDFFVSNQVQSIINITSWRTPNVNSIIINIPMKMTQIESTTNYFPS
jgi:hypothetical protein